MTAPPKQHQIYTFKQKVWHLGYFLPPILMVVVWLSMQVSHDILAGNKRVLLQLVLALMASFTAYAMQYH